MAADSGMVQSRCGWGNTPRTRREDDTSPKRQRGFALPSLALRACMPELLPDVEPCPKMVHIPPGTHVGRMPPKGWSHLVVKSLPRLASGDLVTLPSSAASTATLFRTVIVADVGRLPHDPSSFGLRRIGVGLSVPDRRGSDVVVEPGRDAEVGVELGLTDRIVLRAAEDQLGRGGLAAATPTFALYRGPAAMAVGEEHHD